MSGECLDDVTQIVQSVCAVCNIFLLIYFTKKEWKNEKELRRLNEKEKETDLEHIWYEKFIIDKVVEVLTEYYTSLQKTLNGGKIENTKVFCNEIRKRQDDCKHAIVPYLKTFSGDLSREIVHILQESVDQVLADVEAGRQIISTQTKINVENHIVKILKLLHEYDFNARES